MRRHRRSSTRHMRSARLVPRAGCTAAAAPTVARPGSPRPATWRGELVITRGAVEEDEPRLGERGHRHRAARGEGVARRDDEEHLVLEQRYELDVGMADRPTDADVCLGAKDHLEDLLGVARAYTEADVRIRRAERAQYPRQHVRAHRGCGGYDQRLDVSHPQVRDELAALV